MPTISNLIQSTETARQAAQRRRDAAETQLRSILDGARAAGRANLTADEDRRVQPLFAEHRAARDAITRADDELAQWRREQASDDAIDAQLRSMGASMPESRRPAYDQVARIGNEERTYHRGNDQTGREFLLDVARGFMFQDPASNERLARHAQEERVERGQYLQRAVGTGAFAGLTVPQYLTDQYAPAIAAMRPFANICNSHPLPESGMTVNISRITTATGVALQATENTAVQETNMDDTLLTENVQTAAGQQTVSRQAIERGTGIEDVTMQDLFKRYATTLDATLLNQATTGLSAVAATVTYTSASPTVAELWPKLFAAQNGIEAALLGQAPPTHFVMHPRRWNWMCSQVGSTWPMVAGTTASPQMFATINSNDYGAGIRGIMSNGMKIVVDSNVVTTTGGSQDEVYAVAADECHLWEDPNAPVFIRAEQAAAASLGVLLVVYGMFAYSFRRYTNAVSKIFGTGTTTPTF